MIMLHAPSSFTVLLLLVLCLDDRFVAGRTNLERLDAFNTETCGRVAIPRLGYNRKGRRVIFTIKGRERSLARESQRKIALMNRFRHESARLTPHYSTLTKEPLGQATSRSAIAGEAPWYVSLQTYFDYGNDESEIRYPRCAGTLIHSDLILTAAHCLQRGKYLANKDSYALLGVSDWIERESGTRIGFRRMCLPKNYQPIWSRNVTRQGRDFALIKLEKPVRYSDFVQPACMHELNSCRDASKKRRCKAAGFGHQMIGHRPSQLGVVPMRACWLAELKQHRPDELCFVGTYDRSGQLNVIDRGSGIYCENSETRRTYVVGVSTVNIQPSEHICCPQKPEQVYYTDLFRWRDEISKLLDDCLATTS